jgi:outer membrane protein assembly factor BamB
VVLGLLGTGMPALAEPPSGPAFIEQWRAVPGIHFAGRARVASADVDGDSRPDFVFVASSNYYAGNHALIVAGAMPQGIGIKQALILPEDVNVSIPRVLAATVDGVIHIYTVDDQGTVRDFSGWPLAQVTQYSVAAAVSAAAIGDALGTGEICLVVATSDDIHAYDAATGLSLWNYLNQGTSDIALAQLDADAPLEVVASTGLVIDGATQATDWQYIEAFGSPLATGHLLGDETTQFVAAQNSAFAAYRGTPWSPLWSAGDSYAGIQSLIAANLDDNDRDVIIEGDAQQSGNINAYDSTTHQLRFSISGAGSGAGIQALAAADIDGDGVAELAIAPSQASAFGSASTFTIIDTSSGETEWTYAPMPGTFSQVAIGDVDGDGADELVVAGRNEYYYAPVSIFDAATGALKWQSPAPAGNANDPFYISTSRILLLPHESSAGMDIALAGTSSSSGRITVMDGASHVVKLQIGFYASGPMASRYLVDALALDYDGDGTADYVAATSPAAGGVNGALLQVFSGVDGHTLWTSVPMSSSGSGSINAVLATGPSTDASSELIAVLPASLRAYNMQTQLLDWSLLVAADGAVYLPHGVAGPEIAVFLQTGAVTFYNAVTRAYLRGYTMDAPLTAMFAPDGDSGVLIAASNARLVWLDGHNGSVISTSDFLGNNLGLGNRLAAVDAGPGAWNVASGTDLAIFRHRLELSDRVFATGFENADP